ncbi:MAG TPA: sigma-54 dependent transcriptional regulator [Gemmataceae bacterium]|nr:sigma-54 dependent transcriptional regulator [Gemmataceae bacterium]
MERRILLAEDSKATSEPLKTLLEAGGQFKVDTVADGEAAFKALSEHPYSILLTDLQMPRLDGMKLIERIQEHKLPVTVIVMTGHGPSIDQAVHAMRMGAYDYLPKPVDHEHLRLVIERIMRERTLQDEVLQLRERLQGQYAFRGVLSVNPKMHAVFELIRSVAQTTTTVLIEGETGTGKEQVARAIHDASSSLRSGPFVAINCAALPETLLESELFGHEKGSFTGAVGQRKGRFEQADTGTLFLDEVGDIPMTMQAKLLRVLQERCFERVGGTVSIEVDVRVIAATNRSLTALVKKGKFREDLYYRLNVVKIDLPPLRERTEDIPLLATHFANKHARPGERPPTFAPEAMEKLLNHSWPGNIRELENAIERACVTARSSSIQPEDLPLEVLHVPSSEGSGAQVDLSKKLPDLLREVTLDLERRYLTRAMKKSRGNVGRCAKICGLSRRSISAKLAEYNIRKEAFKEE